MDEKKGRESQDPPREGELDSSKLAEQLYDELRDIARREIGRRSRGTLHTTALVHEAYARFGQGPWKDRSHFLGYASRTMRSILVDYARSKGAQKRGSGQEPTPVDAVDGLLVANGDEVHHILVIDEALERLAESHPDLAELAELRFFGGLTVSETALHSGQPERKVKLASAYLRSLLD